MKFWQHISEFYISKIWNVTKQEMETGFFLSYRLRVYINKVSPHRPLREFHRFIHHLIDVQAGFRKGRRTRDQIANICWIMEKAREFQKNIYFCFIDYEKAFDCVDHNKLWKILQEMGIPDHMTCLL